MGGLICEWAEPPPKHTLTPIHLPKHKTQNTQDATQHVGLKNQGATCYMNSLLQQLFHIPDFRRALLTLELDGPAPAATAATTEPSPPRPPPQQQQGNGDSDKSVLLELQALFALLQTSERKAADTLPFCRALTDYSGEPLLLYEQKDVDEFATLLFDKLESLDPRMDRLLKGLFGGTLVNQVLSYECPHRSEREEPFPMLKVDIKNKSSLEDSLELYVAGELLTGDNKYACRWVARPAGSGTCVGLYYGLCGCHSYVHTPTI